ncbi:hypothetical protein OF83DRAFT_1173368 [Amylostereum chailletii]|nr:hypothetical protein OF83DRAFT_1173368 [Amylostereum chailletii]
MSSTIALPLPPLPHHGSPVDTDDIAVKDEKDVANTIVKEVSSSENSSISGGSSTDVEATTIPSSNSSSLEKGNYWDSYLEDDIPDKTQGHILRNLRHQIFYLYRRLFGVAFVANMAIFIAFCITNHISSKHIGLIVIANLFASILMRNDYVINMFFNVFCAVPHSWPLFIRRHAAHVYHIGGIHSGCAVSATVWLVLFVVQATREVINRGLKHASIPTLVLSWIILIVLVTIIVLAHPRFRILFHNQFEMVHRFLGWTVTALVWAQAVLLINDWRPSSESLGRACPGSFTRMSESPLTEWHSFATIGEPGKTGYSAVVSRAGDWTSRMIEKPPTTLWVRGIPVYGVVSTTILFRRVILVATGSGIGPFTPVILAQKVPLRLLWTAPKVRETYGDEYVDAILDKDPDAVIYDTRKHGKPDMVKLTYKMYKDFNAEAVCIISNEKLTRKVVYGLMSRGVPTFGAIWDS